MAIQVNAHMSGCVNGLFLVRRLSWIFDYVTLEAVEHDFSEVGFGGWEIVNITA